MVLVPVVSVALRASTAVVLVEPVVNSGRSGTNGTSGTTVVLGPIGTLAILVPLVSGMSTTSTSGTYQWQWYLWYSTLPGTHGICGTSTGMKYLVLSWYYQRNYQYCYLLHACLQYFVYNNSSRNGTE